MSFYGKRHSVVSVVQHVNGMFSESFKKFHIILSDFKIFFATREAPIASGKRDIRLLSKLREGV